MSSLSQREDRNEFLLPRRIGSYKDEKILFVGEWTGKYLAEVDTQVVPSKGDRISINYRFHRVQDEWRIYDIVVEDISIVSNYGSQFNRILTTGFFDDLRNQLKKKGSSAAADISIVASTQQTIVWFGVPLAHGPGPPQLLSPRYRALLFCPMARIPCARNRRLEAPQKAPNEGRASSEISRHSFLRYYSLVASLSIG